MSVREDVNIFLFEAVLAVFSYAKLKFPTITQHSAETSKKLNFL